jgi:integrase
LSEDEIKKLLDQPLNDRDRAIILVLSGTGIRVGECRNLCFKDIGNDTIKVRGKTGEREVPLHPSVREGLLKLKNGNGLDSPIFYGNGNHKYKPLDVAGIQNAVRRIFKNAGIIGKRASPHTLRHTFGKNFTANGGNTLTLMRILGHENLATTQRYVNLATKDLIEQNLKCNPLRSLSVPEKTNHSISMVENSIPQPENSITRVDNNIAQ